MIRKLSEFDIQQVAKLHKEELSGFIPELGKEFLNLFYKTSAEMPEMFTFVQEEKGNVLGFVSGITDARGLNKKILLRRPLRFVFILLRYLIVHPQKTAKFFRILAYPGFSEGGAELLSLAVSSDCRLQGIGRKLFRATAKEFKRRGIKKFRISAYKKLPANKFYEKMGCRFISSFEFLGERMNYYEYKI